MKTLLATLFFWAAAPLIAALAAADEPSPPSERLAAEGWAILNGDSDFEPFCDRPALAQDRFMRAIQYDPDSASAFRGWGRAVEDLARCPVGGGLVWSDTVRLTSPETKTPVNLPRSVIIDATYKFRRAAELAPDDPAVWADWGRSLMNLAALEGTAAERLEMVDLAEEKYERAAALLPDSAELRLVWARGLLPVLTAESDPEAWPVLWNRVQERYYQYIDLSPDATPKAAGGAAKSRASASRQKADPPESGGVSPKLTAWSVYGREVSQAARDFQEPEKTRLPLASVIESMRLLVVAKPDYDLSLDVNSLSRAYLDLMAVTPGEEQWLELLNQAGDLALRMIELDHENPVIDFVLWSWRRSAEAEPDPYRRSALIAKALSVVEALGAREVQAARSAKKTAPASAGQAKKGSGKGKGQAAKAEPPKPEEAPADSSAGTAHTSRFLMSLAAVMDQGSRRAELLERADRGFEQALARAEGESAARLRLIWAQELMTLAALEADLAQADLIIGRAEEQFRLSLETTARPGLSLIIWANELERLATAAATTVPATTVAVSPRDGSAAEAAAAGKRASATDSDTAEAASPSEGSAAKPASAGKRASATDSAAASSFDNDSAAQPAADGQPAPADSAADATGEESSAAENTASSGEAAPGLKTPAAVEIPAQPEPPAQSREEILFEAAIEKYQLAAALPGGERALDQLGGLYFKRALAEKNQALAEGFWLKALENYRRAAIPGEGEPLNGEASFRLGQIYATLAARGQPAARACLKDSGQNCLAAAMRVYRDVFADLPEAVNRSVSAGASVIRPDLTPALLPRPDNTRLGPGLSLTRTPARDAAESRRRALTRVAADGFLQLLLAVDPTDPPPPPKPVRRSAQAPPPKPPEPERRVRLQGTDRALLAALYRMAAGYRQMNPEYKAIYLRRAEDLY